MASRSLGIFIVFAGLAAVVIGLLVWAGGLSWFGRLPGDIRIERENFTFYFPLTSMILVSVVLSLALNLLQRLLR